MKIIVNITQRTGIASATAEYDGKVMTVLAGGKINLDFAEHIRGGKLAKAYRENPEYVDKDGNIIKNCEFTSPSTAAQFVTGRSTNGYEAWKVEKKLSLGKYLKDKGLR
ncbi:DUF4357 domain-containing protein [Anaerotignum sp. MSJ-24]|uniref:DUF4357 domain-containing protein n=1 Tax=Anaerotignum sp. MSJ-24 TaxID=2841521 RepID=UPI001C0F8D5F|nr:DUF4357 domain-containing protein [Anaerotignum sp. MSJ-24]MBU5465107.1 DUF4357 domain-containing protein [Anaerotignum sp. MSJ-24]